MNFIELVKAVRLRVGMQGTGPSSVTTTGYEAALVAAVSDAWIDIQNERKDWKWMRETASFLTSQGVNEYSVTNILGPSARHKYWLKDTAYIMIDGQYKHMRNYRYDNFVYLNQNNTEETTPDRYTIRDNNYSIIMQYPDSAYTIKIDYQKSPQVLVSDTDIPELPSYYHLLIVYAAVEKYASYISNPETYQQYSLQHARMMNQVMRDQLPKKIVKPTGGIA